MSQGHGELEYGFFAGSSLVSVVIFAIAFTSWAFGAPGDSFCRGRCLDRGFIGGHELKHEECACWSLLEVEKAP